MKDGAATGSLRGDSVFARAAKELLAPVLAELGFSVVDTSAREMRFESDRVWAWVFHEDAPSNAIGFRFDRLDAPNADGAYLVSHAMRLVNPARAARDLDPSAETEEEVRQALERLRRAVQTYCLRALRGDADVFAAMKRGRDLYSRQYSEWTRRSQEMGESDAVGRGDWARVVAIYESAEHDLNGLDQKSLEVAQQNARTMRDGDQSQRDDPALKAEMTEAFYDFVGNLDGTDEDRQRIELEVGKAMDARDWAHVIELYETSPYEPGVLQRARLEIARRRLVDLEPAP